MKSLLIDLFICPACLPRENELTCHIDEKIGEDIISGSLLCSVCGAGYPIRDGIASLLPGSQQISSKYESPPLLPPYLWSHYGDLLADDEAGTAYEEWSNLLEFNPGFSLDAGCAVGRFTFELGQKSDFAVGIDNSRSFIRKARELMINRQTKVSIPEEGLLLRHETINLPETWRSDTVEFIVGDAQALPFRAGFFTTLASLNLVDKVPLPLVHLKEMSRVAKESQAGFLLSDPFSWSSDLADEADWLGGTTGGSFPGRGIDNILSILRGETGDLSPPWMIEKQGSVWWKIRNHRNHFELIRSCYIKAGR